MLDKLEEILSLNVAPYAITSAAIVLLLAFVLAYSQRKRAEHVRSAIYSDANQVEPIDSQMEDDSLLYAGGCLEDSGDFDSFLAR